MQTEETNIPEYHAPLNKETIETSTILTQPTPDNPPWNSWTAFGVWAAYIVLIMVLPSIFILIYALQKGIKATDSEQLLQLLKTDSTAIIINVVAIIPAHILTLILAWFVVTRYNKFSFKKTLGWSWGGFAWWHILVILGGFFVTASIVLYYFPVQEDEFDKILRSSRTAIYLVAIVATLSAPIVEEIVHRGILYSAFQRSFGAPLAILFASLIFTLIHIPQYMPNYSKLFLLYLISLILTLIRFRTKNLLPCIVLHAVFNGIQAFILILEPFLTNFANQSEGKTAAFIRFLM